MNKKSKPEQIFILITAFSVLGLLFAVTGCGSKKSTCFGCTYQPGDNGDYAYYTEENYLEGGCGFGKVNGGYFYACLNDGCFCKDSLLTFSDKEMALSTECCGIDCTRLGFFCGDSCIILNDEKNITCFDCN